ncbi:unnamed protein product, partial [Dibothriocephalus latus]
MFIGLTFRHPSLFSSIPQDLAIETVELLLRNKYGETENRPGHAQILQLLKFCLRTRSCNDWSRYFSKKRLKSASPDIQFTMEEEENNQLAFLDVLVCRKDYGGLKTKVFRKATNTMQVVNNNSNHPISHKRSCVKTLSLRVETHCSEEENKVTEVEYL